MAKRTKLLSYLLLLTLLIALPQILPIPSAPQLRSESDSLRNEITSLNQQLQLTELGRSPDFVARNEDAILKIPDGPDLPSLIDELQKLANTAGLEWVSGAPAKIGDESDVNTWFMTMIVEGSYDQVLLFNDQTPSLQRLVTIESVTLQKLQNDKVTATLSLKFYALSPSDTKV
ncbi:MAG: type 4a pilus biogenesis protein PilO [Candidatus Paceibacterota bacterium]